MNARSPLRTRLRRSRVVFFVSGLLLCVFYTLTLNVKPSRRADGGDVMEVSIREVNVTEQEVDASPDGTKPSLVLIVNRTDIEQCIYVDPQPPKVPPTAPPASITTAPPFQSPHQKGEYPQDIFSVEQRRQGWVILHIIGMTYMFVALAIVCDEFFVPALEVITNKLNISDDVAGATFMAAGGSAPELFTSLIGVFIAHSNVGIGTIVGSAVFNILFVIGMCAIFSREMLNLTWWPLFRDVTFYIVHLIMLIVFFVDNMILWWESILLVLGYVGYVSFMKFNSKIEQMVKTWLNKHMSIVKVWTAEEPEKEREAPTPPVPPAPVPPAPPPENKPEPAPHPGSPQHSKTPSESQDNKMKLRVRPTLQRGGSTASLHNTSLRSTIFQLMIHTLEPLGEDRELRDALTVMSEGRGQCRGKHKSSTIRARLFKFTVMNKVKPLNVSVTEKSDRKSQRRHSEVSGFVFFPLLLDGELKPKAEQTSDSTGPPGGAAAEASTSQPPKNDEKTEKPADQAETTKPSGSESSGDNTEDESGDEGSSDSSRSGGDDENGEEKEKDEEEEENEPLSLDWPETSRKQATYLFLLPIMFPLWLTLPDVRNPASKRYFAITFIGSILWIAVFSYLMVWWAHQVGETVGISEEIMGLTILAAGTSIPDLITSVIVARKGLGDMAVSSSVGSNIFDITVGLPIPWLIYTLIHNGEPVTVSSNGLFCAIVLLFLMLLFVIIAIAACRWRMSRKLGLTMFVLYFVFLILSVLLEERILICPVSI
ncbi:sodium/potassium/calcium exchanger 2-like [Thalassophryne amazonica]|uniref:sodium/potassium/calcium exchanger 2-like n=1 Tax=Thalassophryne amazonica TaxID=390379 RepID=UPI0014709927|nr:sodium/potassium/calcium exchanger 2-like [Thalassophryne amazonica]